MNTRFSYVFGILALSATAVEAADPKQNCWKPVFQNCESSGADNNTLTCNLDLGLVQQGVNTHIYGCETRLTSMLTIVEIQIVGMRDHGGLAFYDFKFNRDVEGRSQLTFGFSRPVQQTDPLTPRAFVTVIGRR